MEKSDLSLYASRYKQMKKQKQREALSSLLIAVFAIALIAVDIWILFNVTFPAV